MHAGVDFMKRRDFALFVATVAAGLARPALGTEQPPLWVDGDIRDAGGVALHDADLSALEQRSFETSTVWTQGTDRFSGPSLQLLLQHLGAGPGNLRLTAVNNYSVEVDRSLLTADAPIVANRINDLAFDRRSKGPFWVMFPFDQAPEFRNPTIYAACVWQLSGITVLKGLP
jgi:hypothetical protein